MKRWILHLPSPRPRNHTYRTGSFGNVKNDNPDFLRMALLQPYAEHHLPRILTDIFNSFTHLFDSLMHNFTYLLLQMAGTTNERPLTTPEGDGRDSWIPVGIPTFIHNI